MCFCVYIFLVSLHLTLGKCDFTVEHVKVEAEVSKDVFFSCSSSSGTDVTWTLPSGERLLPGQASEDRRFKNINGSLLISNVKLADSGRYNCSGYPKVSCIGTLKAFLMPNYTIDFSIICGLNVILLILFLVTTILNHLRYRSSSPEKQFGSVIDL
nr:Immunoglobulin subtype [Hymenolepis microstoma]